MLDSRSDLARAFEAWSEANQQAWSRKKYYTKEKANCDEAKDHDGQEAAASNTSRAANIVEAQTDAGNTGGHLLLEKLATGQGRAEGQPSATGTSSSNECVSAARISNNAVVAPISLR